jgi:hypothetical protein
MNCERAFVAALLSRLQFTLYIVKARGGIADTSQPSVANDVLAQGSTAMQHQNALWRLHPLLIAAPKTEGEF